MTCAPKRAVGKRIVHNALRSLRCRGVHACWSVGRRWLVKTFHLRQDRAAGGPTAFAVDRVEHAADQRDEDRGEVLHQVVDFLVAQRARKQKFKTESSK